MPMSNAPASTPLQPAPPSATNRTSGPLAAKPVGTGPTSPSSSSLVEALRETVRDAPPTVVLRSGGGEAAMEAATSMKGEGGGLCVGGQLYEQQAEQKQALRIRQLERELAQAKLKLQHVVTTEEMARSQARQLQTTLDMLLDDGGGGVDGPDAPGGGGAGGGNREAEDAEHDAVTADLGQRVGELEASAAAQGRERTALETSVALLSAELRQRFSAQRRAACDVQEELAQLVVNHA